MTSQERFVHWQSGFSEIQQNPPDAAQWSVIRERLREALGHQPASHVHAVPPDAAHHQPTTVVSALTATPTHENHFPAPSLLF
jgi:hypothetical protein